MAALPKARKTFSVRLTYFFLLLLYHIHLPCCGELLFIQSRSCSRLGLGIQIHFDYSTDIIDTYVDIRSMGVICNSIEPLHSYKQTDIIYWQDVRAMHCTYARYSHGHCAQVLCVFSNVFKEDAKVCALLNSISVNHRSCNRV